MQWPSGLMERAYRHPETAELGWLRADALSATGLLASHGLAVLGGEAWMVLGASRYLLRHIGPEGYYAWHTRRAAGEGWDAFVQRSRSEADAAILNDEPLRAADVPAEALVYYNLVWVSAAGRRYNTP